MTLPELSAELLPCPNLWCNDSKPTIVSRKGESREYHNVFCDTCDIGPSPSFHSRSEAIAAWNTRIGQLVERDGVAGVVEALELAERWLAAMKEATNVPPHISRMAAADYPKIEAALTAIKGGDHD